MGIVHFNCEFKYPFLLLIWFGSVAFLVAIVAFEAFGFSLKCGQLLLNCFPFSSFTLLVGELFIHIPPPSLFSLCMAVRVCVFVSSACYNILLIHTYIFYLYMHVLVLLALAFHMYHLDVVSNYPRKSYVGVC